MLGRDRSLRAAFFNIVGRGQITQVRLEMNQMTRVLQISSIAGYAGSRGVSRE